jgi:anti-sigma B factor antagonist
MSNLKLTTREQEGVTILSCNGRIVFGDESSALRDQVKNLIAEGKSNIVVNLGGVSYIDSGGLGTIVSLFTSARVGDLLQITKLLTVFETFDGEGKAVEAFQKRKATA